MLLIYQMSSFFGFFYPTILSLPQVIEQRLFLFNHAPNHFAGGGRGGGRLKDGKTVRAMHGEWGGGITALFQSFEPKITQPLPLPLRFKISCTIAAQF